MLTDRVLVAMLHAGHGNQQDTRRKAGPDWAYVDHELRRPGVTLMLLSEECRQPAYRRWPSIISCQAMPAPEELIPA
jgi:hypothetical protein